MNTPQTSNFDADSNSASPANNDVDPVCTFTHVHESLRVVVFVHHFGGCIDTNIDMCALYVRVCKRTCMHADDVYLQAYFMDLSLRLTSFNAAYAQVEYKQLRYRY